MSPSRSDTASVAGATVSSAPQSNRGFTTTNPISIAPDLERTAVDAKVLDDEERVGPCRLDRDGVTVRDERMCSWQVAVMAFGPCGTPLIISPQAPQMPSRQSESKAIGSSPCALSRSFSVKHLEERHVLGDVPRSVSAKGALGRGVRLTPNHQREFHVLPAPR